MSGLRARFRLGISRARAIFLRLDRPLFVLWTAAWTLASARAFYGYMLKQTGGEWSAPLDDVFIHFDYARSTALGHPFEWVVGNGYSSGNTSLSYPFVLAFGWLVGFRDMSLMKWAAVVAMVCTFGALLAARWLFAEPGSRDVRAKALSYLMPVMVLGVGALDWSLWSGMEVAFFLGTWALALAAWVHLERLAPGSRERRQAAWLLGLAGMVMVVTRPEAATTIAIFGVFALFPSGSSRRRVRGWGVLGELTRVGFPSVAILALQSICNRMFTGEWSANGAIVKLAVNSPYLTPAAKLDDYDFNLLYAALRNLEYHFADQPAFGILVPGLACVALASPKTRRMALLLWAQIAGWLFLVAMNGQVRWQNERYTMPAVAWLLIAAALGASALVRGDRRARPTFLVAAVLGALLVEVESVITRPQGTPPVFQTAWWIAIGLGVSGALALRVHAVRVIGAAAVLYLAFVHQETRMREQKWFFGRASRNIRDQHVTTGRWLRHLDPQKKHRVLVGDAGAITYASDMPGLDIIGLGGLHNFPFARAGLNGLASTIELMEYVPPSDRPDLMAIYPSWWGVLPTWFSSKELARFPAEGNVICGGYEDVVYEADWHLLGTGNAPRVLRSTMAHPMEGAILDEVDVADILSEMRHAYRFPQPEGGWTEMKVLADPAEPTEDMLDGGRRIEQGRAERFTLRKLVPGKAAKIVLRTAPEGATTVRASVGGADVGEVNLVATNGWVEKIIDVPGERVSAEIDVVFANAGPKDFVDYHVWIVQ